MVDESRAQTFTFEQTGVLREIRLELFDQPRDSLGVGPLADSIVLEVRATENGVPLGTQSVLGAVVLQRVELDLAGFDPLTFDFTPLGISVASGDVLAFVLPPGSGGALLEETSRSGGSSFIARDFGDDFEDRGIDYDFEILVVPEPTPALFIVLGLAYLSRRVGIYAPPLTQVDQHCQRLVGSARSRVQS